MTSKDPFLNAAVHLAKEAGQLLLRHLDGALKVDTKGVSDIVTTADRASEELILDGLRAAFPDHAMLGEEVGHTPRASEYCWIVDPLDGTINYAAGVPIFSVSIALFQDERPTVGVVYDPNRPELFHAIRGEGAYLNDRPICVHEGAWPHAPLFAVSSSVVRSEHLPEGPHYVGNISSIVRQYRNIGAASLNMCYMAAGRFNGYIDTYTKLWDFAASSLIITEAGGIFTAPSGVPIFPIPSDSGAYVGENVPVLATNREMHRTIVEMMLGK